MSDLKSLLNNQDGTSVPDPLLVDTLYVNTINPLSGATLTINNAILNPPPPSAPATEVFNVINPASTDFLGARLSTKAQRQFVMDNQGISRYGSGDAAQDTYFYRSSANTMALGQSASDTLGDLGLRSLFIDATGSVFTGGASNLTLNPAGPAVDFSGKNIIDIDDVAAITGDFATSTTTPLINTNAGNLTLNPAGASVDFSGKSIINTTSVSTTAGNLTLNPAGASVDFSGKGITNAATASLATSLTVPLINTAAGNLVLNPTGVAVDFSGKQIINAVIASSGLTFPISYGTATGTNEFVKCNVTGDTQPRFSVIANGNVAFGPGNVAQDVHLRRSAVGELIVSTASTGSTGGTIAVAAIRGAGGALQITGGPVDFSGNNIFNILQMTGATISLNNALSTSNMFASRVTLETQPRYGMDVDGQLSWGSGGAVSRDTWMYRTFDNTLRISATSRGPSSTGILEVGTLRSTTVANVDLLNVNGSSNNTMSGTTQVAVVGQTNTLSNCARILINGASNSVENASSSAIVGSSSCTLDSNSSTSANHFIGGCTSVSIGSGTGNTGSNNVILATDGITGGMIIGNSSNQVLAKGNKFSITPSNCVVFGDDGSGFGSTTTIGSDNIMQCAFRQGLYFTSNAARTVGIQVAPGANTVTSISDARLKDIWGEIPVEQAYAALTNVRVVNYSWKDCPKRKRQLGMIAQEVNAAFGEFMDPHENKFHQYSLDHPEEDPIQTVSGDEIAYVSMALIKHQKDLIAGLQSENENLKFQMQLIFSRMASMENDQAEMRKKLNDAFIGL